MKPNLIIALLVGGVVGFAVGRMASGTPGGTQGGNNQPVAAAPSPSPSPQAPRPQGGGDDSVLRVPVEGSPTHGPDSALITLVEFSDYQCPFCSRANNTVRQLEQDYGEKLRVVMKQNPLSFHPFAKPAATAAIAAGAQNKYWEMHHKMFDNQQNLDEASLEKYAQEIGLNMEKWKADRNAGSVNDQISKDQALAGQLGANGTPAFFINGRKLSGAQPIDRFKALIDEELGKAQALVNQGTPANQVYAKVMAGAAAAPPPPPAQPQQPSQPQAPAPAAVRNVKVPDDSPAKGPKTAKVTIVLWSDFQCPFCSRVVPTLKQIEDTYAKDVRIVFRHQPLPFHQNAKPAAEATMAAHEQGKFWPMHDKLFANQQALERASLEKYAQEIGLDMGKFKSALDSGKFRARVEADSAAGNEVGANGTPTFFINGREFVGAQPFEAFKSMIDDEIKHADRVLATGVKPAQLYEKVLEDGIKNAPAAPAPGQPGQPAAPAAVANIDLGGAPVKGPKNAPVTIVAWSDFQCPFCSRVVPTLKELEKQYEGKIKVAFKNQPLPFHQNARIAASAGLAANEQGKFWDMHDKMFANQQALDRASLERYAQEIGLDVGKFKSALDSNKYDAQITKESNEGSAIGANGTPTFFINGRQLVGAQPIEQFKALIDEELQKKKK